MTPLRAQVLAGAEPLGDLGPLAEDELPIVAVFARRCSTRAVANALGIAHREAPGSLVVATFERVLRERGAL